MSLVMLLGWYWQQRHQNAGIVDVLWALLMTAAGVFYAISGQAQWPVALLVGALIGLWYGSLAWFLWRRLRGHEEEGRYRYLRQYWGNHAGRWHLLFFQLQALLAWTFTLPAWFITRHQAVVTDWQLLAGVVLVVVAWCGERLADGQLAAFKATPHHQGKVCNVGLWRYSRHPNYFFEWLQWFIWPLLALYYPNGAWLWLAPATMWLFLYWVTGIPYTEQQALRTRGDAYRDYQRTTSPFIPWRPGA
jgi:cyclopropane-fatty-acyl-phospholipid synthase